ncbi:hypothetical protein [Telluribacter humicola]|uniref:hypothetical protein n=1 Tax=Telluribacter humicola TaxID=1720261 RepID=UPI001A963B84|nr:hypothetical protein [Telluribacter humicola]
MQARTITLCYRKIVDAASTKLWDRLVFEDSYREFRMQAQLYNPDKKYRTFGELIQHSAGAEQLHFLVSAAAIGYLQQLNETMPDVVNNLGKHFLKFNQFQFEIINSDVHDKTKHAVAINFFSVPMVWHDSIGNYLLISDTTGTERQVLTHMLQVQPFLSIHSLTNSV